MTSLQCSEWVRLLGMTVEELSVATPQICDIEDPRHRQRMLSVAISQACLVVNRQISTRNALRTSVTPRDRPAGHNADDVAETVLLNLLRGDLPRLGRCTNIITGEDGSLPRVKPFKYTYEKEIVMYAYFKKLDYFSTECIYSPFAARGFAREFVKDLEVAFCLFPSLSSPKHCVPLVRLSSLQKCLGT